MFVKTFKGYEDRTAELDKEINTWIVANGEKIDVLDIHTVLSHEHESRARSGDLIYTVLYRASSPVD
jgi:hypothetical protein